MNGLGSTTQMIPPFAQETPLVGDDGSIGASAQPACPLCSSEGAIRHPELVDRLFGAPGRWTMRRCLNANCGLHWLDPMPLEEEIGKAYQVYYTHGAPPEAEVVRVKHHATIGRLWRFIKHGYLASSLGYTAGTTPFQRILGRALLVQPLLRRSLDMGVYGLPFTNGGELVDVGCGAGTFAAYARSLGWKVDGCDVDPKAVAAARQRGIVTHEGSFMSMNLPSNSRDAITMSHVIEHVHDPGALLVECHRVLRSKGSMIALTPNADSIQHRFFGSAWRGLEPPRHLQLFTTQSLQELAERAGLRASVTTTAEGAVRLYRQSRAIAEGGNGTRNHTHLDELRAQTFGIIESLATLCAPAGNTLVLRATKA